METNKADIYKINHLRSQEWFLRNQVIMKAALGAPWHRMLLICQSLHVQGLHQVCKIQSFQTWLIFGKSTISPNICVCFIQLFTVGVRKEYEQKHPETLDTINTNMTERNTAGTQHLFQWRQTIPVKVNWLEYRICICI